MALENCDSISGWVENRIQASRRSGSVLISLFADFVEPHGGAVALGSLVEAGALVGISEQTIRSSVNRLVADGWLTSEAMGRRSICRFSQNGVRRNKIASQRVYQKANEVWEGEWQLIAANNWLLDNETYSDLVKDLLLSGFGKLSDNVFIKPKFSQKDVCCDESLKETLISSMVSFSGRTGCCIPESSVRTMGQRAWDLGAVMERYKEFIARYENLLGMVWKTPRLPGAQAFSIRSMMIHDYRRIRLLDPTLPETLLPDGWNGDKALYIAHELYDLLMPSSEQFVMETMQGPEGRIPHVDSSFYDRFGGLTRN